MKNLVGACLALFTACVLFLAVNEYPAYSIAFFAFVGAFVVYCAGTYVLCSIARRWLDDYES